MKAEYIYNEIEIKIIRIKSLKLTSLCELKYKKKRFYANKNKNKKKTKMKTQTKTKIE